MEGGGLLVLSPFLASAESLSSASEYTLEQFKIVYSSSLLQIPVVKDPFVQHTLV